MQSQLNAKASTSALSATAESIGADLNSVEATLGAVGATDLLATNAALEATTASTQTELTVISAAVALKAPQTSLDSVALAVSGKQDLIGDALVLGALAISGGADVALLQHSEGVALQAGGSTYALFTPVGATVRQLTVRNGLVIPDDAIQLAKVSGLTAALAQVDTLSTDLALKHTTGEELEFTSGGVQHRISTVGGNFRIPRLVDGAFSSMLSILVNESLGLSRIAIPGASCARPVSLG